jgi:hypothetical protein
MFLHVIYKQLENVMPKNPIYNFIWMYLQLYSHTYIHTYMGIWK